MRKFTFSERALRATSLWAALLGCSLSLGLMHTASAGIKTIAIPNSTATALISDHLVSLADYEHTNYQLPENTLVYVDNNSFVYFKLVDKTAATQFLNQLPAIAQGFKYSTKPVDLHKPLQIPNAYVNYFNRASLVGTVDSTVYRNIMGELELHKPRNQLLLEANFSVGGTPTADTSAVNTTTETAPTQEAVSPSAASEPAVSANEASTGENSPEATPATTVAEAPATTTTPLVSNCDIPAVTSSEQVTRHTTDLTLAVVDEYLAQQNPAAPEQTSEDCFVNGQAVVPVAPPADAPQGTQAAVSKYPPMQAPLPVQPTPLPTNEQLGGTSAATNQPAVAPALPVQPTPLLANENLYNDAESDAEFAELQAKFVDYNPATSLTLLSAAEQQLYVTYQQHLQALAPQTSVAEAAVTDEQVAGNEAVQQEVAQDAQAFIPEQASETVQTTGADLEQIEQRPVDLAPQPELSEQALQYLGSRDYPQPQFNQTLFDVWLNPSMRAALENDIFATQLVRLQNFTTPEYRLVTVKGTPALRMDSHVLNMTREYRGKYQFQHAVVMDYSPTQYLVGVYYYYGDQVEARDVTFGAELFLNSMSTGK